MMQKYLRIALAVVIVVAAPIAYWYAKNNGSLNPTSSAVNQLLSDKYAVTEVPDSSFGELNATAAGGRGAGAGGEMANPSASSAQLTVDRPQSGGGSDSKLIAPYPQVNYRFRYDGAELGEMSPEQPVYKRVKETVATGIVDRIISTLSLGLIDLTKFESTKLQNFTINEEKEFGYSIFVDVDQGNLNMYQNYNQWPQPLTQCQDDECYRAQMPKLADIPEDQVIIDIANQFVSEKAVSLNGYGQARVANNWRQMYEAFEDKANFYFPEVIDVVYPLMIDGQEVFDEGGAPSGLHINVDYRKKRVVGLYDLTTKQYERSNYTGETDNDRIIEIAEKGGFRSYFDGSTPGGRVTTLNLDTPVMQVLRMWRFDNNKSEEIFVPALVFPIKNQGNYWRPNVIVPLVKEILDKENQPPVTIMKGSAGSTEPAPAPDLPPVTKPEVLDLLIPSR
jgi:hypothetical protein